MLAHCFFAETQPFCPSYLMMIAENKTLKADECHSATFSI